MTSEIALITLNYTSYQRYDHTIQNESFSADNFTITTITDRAHSRFK